MTLETSNNLALHRKKRGYSQEKLAEMIGVSRQTISKWERCEASPDTDNLIALSTLYGITLDELLYPKKEDTLTLDGIPEAPHLDAAEMPEATSFGNDVWKENFEDSFDWGQLYKFPYPVICVIAFFLLGTLCNFWHGWLLFLTVPLYYGGIAALKHGKWSYFPFPVVLVLFYLFVGLFLHIWHPTWIVFLTIPFYYWFASVRS